MTGRGRATNFDSFSFSNGGHGVPFVVVFVTSSRARQFRCGKCRVPSRLTPKICRSHAAKLNRGRCRTTRGCSVTATATDSDGGSEIGFTGGAGWSGSGVGVGASWRAAKRKHRKCSATCARLNRQTPAEKLSHSRQLGGLSGVKLFIVISISSASTRPFSPAGLSVPKNSGRASEGGTVGVRVRGPASAAAAETTGLPM